MMISQFQGITRQQGMLALLLACRYYGERDKVSVLAQDSAAPPAGMVYAMTNSLSRNEIVAFARAADGTLLPAGHFDTEGLGSGAFENSNSALIVASANGQSSPVDLGGGNDLVLAVNAGSDTISVFRVLEMASNWSRPRIPAASAPPA